MSSLLGAIHDYYTNDDGAEPLRNLVSGLYADIMPPDIVYPFIVLAETGRQVTDMVKGLNMWIERVTVTFDTYGPDRATVESIFDTIEDVFVPGPTLTVDRRKHMATYPGNRFQGNDYIDGQQGDCWHGVIEMTFQLQRKD